MKYCGHLRQSTAITKAIGQLISYEDGKTSLYDALGGNDNFDPTEFLLFTLIKGITPSKLNLSKIGGNNDMNLIPGGMATLELTAANTDTLGDLIVSFENRIEGGEIILSESFQFVVIPAAIYDSLYSSSATALATAASIAALNNLSSAQAQSAAAAAIAGVDLATETNATTNKAEIIAAMPDSGVSLEQITSYLSAGKPSLEA